MREDGSGSVSAHLVAKVCDVTESVILSDRYRGVTVPITQYNGLCHVTQVSLQHQLLAAKATLAIIAPTTGTLSMHEVMSLGTTQEFVSHVNIHDS